MAMPRDPRPQDELDDVDYVNAPIVEGTKAHDAALWKKLVWFTDAVPPEADGLRYHGPTPGSIGARVL